MFTGVVVESFAYVYQMPGGASLSREEMRKSDVVNAALTRQALSRSSGQSSIQNERGISSAGNSSVSSRCVTSTSPGIC